MPLAVIVAALSVLQQLSTNNTSYTLCQKDVHFLFFKQLCQKLTKFYRASSYASAVLRVVILSVCPPVTRVLCDMHCRCFDITITGILTPTMLGWPLSAAKRASS